MGRFQKAFLIFSLVYTAAYILFFFETIKTPINPAVIVPLQLLHPLEMALYLGSMTLVIRDIFKRDFVDPNAKATWILLILMFFPSILIYLSRYGFKPRSKAQESGGDLKYIIGLVVVTVAFFGFMVHSLHSAPRAPESMDDLAILGKNDEILLRLGSSTGDEELNGNGRWSPLHTAASNNRTSTVKIFLDHGAEIDQQCECNGNTPLHVAAKKGYYEVVKVLLDAGADKSILNDANKTAFDLAREREHAATAELLSR